MTPDELKAARTRLKLDQRQMAAALGVDQSTVSKWETGDRRIPELAAKLIARLVDDAKKRKR